MLSHLVIYQVRPKLRIRQEVRLSNFVHLLKLTCANVALR
jgi:hypothetical protein